MMRPEDAAAAARAGGDAIGIVFYTAAPRHVSVDRATEILAAIPPFVTPVGLFADAPAAEVIEIARRLNIRHVQLHGHEPPQVVAELGAALTVLKAVRVTRDSLTQTLEMWRAAIRDLHLRNLAGLLMETATTKGMGGTGVENDWEAIAAAQRAGAFDGLPPLIVAGGLSPANVGQVVRLLRPWAVDVSSSVEESRGVKSVDRMHAFAAAVRASDQSFSP